MDKIRSSCESFSLVKFLGKGSFAEVWHAKCDRTNEEVAIKIVDKSKISTRIRIDEEIRIQSELNHVNIVKLFQHFEDPNHVYLVMELCQGGTLQKYLETCGGKLMDKEARPLFKQIVEGVHYLHSHGIIHRDLSISNLLLKDCLTVKISDFGLAKQLQHRDEKHSTMCGTPNFISPEIVTQRPHGLEVDTFSLGCILYTMLVGSPPFDTKTLGSTLNRVRKVDFSLPGYLQPDSRSLILSLLKKNPRDRISLQEMLHHPFVQGRNVPNGAFKGLQDSGLGSTATTLSSNGDCSYSRHMSHKQGPFDGQLSVIYSERSYTSCQSVPASVRSARDNTQVVACSDHGSLQTVNRPSSRVSKASSVHSSCLRTECAHPCERELSHMTKQPVIEQHIRLTAQDQCPLQPPISRLDVNSCSQTLQRSVCSHAGVSCPTHCVHAMQCCCHSVSPAMSQNAQQPVSAYSPAEFGENKARSEPVVLRERWSPSGSSLAEIVSPLSTRRLKPTTQRTKNAIVSITESGDIVLEFLRRSGRQEKVKSVCRISSDGLRVCIQRPSRGMSPALGRPVHEGDQIMFSYQSLPKEHWPKYEYAVRFLNLVQAKTPKVTLYSELSKTVLMENRINFESEYYEGERVSLASSELSISTTSGQTYTLKFGDEYSHLGTHLKRLLDHFGKCHQHCVNIESVLSLVETKTQQHCFPVIIGRRPVKTLTVFRDSNKEN